MSLELRGKIAGFARRSGAAKISVMIYLFLLPVEELWPIRVAALAVIFASLVVKATRKDLKVDLKDRSNLGFALFFAITFIGALFSPYRFDSFKAILTGVFSQAVVYIAVITEYDGYETLKPLFYALFAGFALYALQMAYIFVFAQAYWPTLLEFAYFSAVCAPLVLAYLLTSGNDMREKRYVLYMCVPGIFLALFSGSMAFIAAMLASFGYMLVLSGRYKFFSVFAAVLVSAAIVISVVMPTPLTGPAHGVEAKVSKDEESVSAAAYGRGGSARGHWKMTLDLLMTRPFFGFGYGRDRFRGAAIDAGYLNGIETTDATYIFFDRGYVRSAGSHNAFIEALFEVGAAGFAAYAFFWFTIIRKTKGIFLAVSKSPCAVFLRIGVAGFLLALLALSMVESLWDGRSGVLIIVTAAVAFVMHREFEAIPKDYRTVWVFEK